MAESLRFGIVSTSDMYYFIDDMVRATSEAADAKANISRAIVNFARRRCVEAALHAGNEKNIRSIS